MIVNDVDVDFERLAAEVATRIASYGYGAWEVLQKDRERWTEIQQAQFERLVAAETAFVTRIWTEGRAPTVMPSFVSHVRDEMGHPGKAKPFFRVRSSNFVRYAPAFLEGGDWRVLEGAGLNYHFAAWAQATHDVDAPGLREIADARTEMIEMNMPLAIKEAREFWYRGANHRPDRYSVLDFIQFSIMGLMAGVDKFEPPYRTVVRSTIMTNSQASMGRAFSETSVKFLSKDRRKLYHVRRALSRSVDGDVGLEALTQQVNAGLPEDHHVEPQEVVGLLQATNPVSIDRRLRGGADPNDDGAATLHDRVGSDDSDRPDCQYEAAELKSALRSAWGQLSLLHVKHLRMLGVRPEV